MKAHELAAALRVLSSLLKNGPNVEITEFSNLSFFPRDDFRLQLPSRRNSEVPLALSALLSLSRIDKKDWIALVADLGVEIDVRPRDASRDIVGKVLRVLENDTEARERLERRIRSKDSKASPELARALSSLLGGQ